MDPKLLELVVSRPSDEPDFTLIRKTNPTKPWVCDARDRSPEGKAAALRRILQSEVSPGEQLILGEGSWNLGLNYLRLPPCRITGRGRTKTAILCSQEDQRHYCGIEQSRGSMLDQMTLIWHPKDEMVRGGQTVGIADPNYTGLPIIGCRLQDMDVISYGSVAWYFWGAGKFHKFRAEDVGFYAGRIGVEQGMASASDCVDIEMINCHITVNFAKYGGAGGMVGQRTIGFLLRGGSATMTGGSINVLGYGGSGLTGDVNCDPFEMAVGAATSPWGDPAMPVYGNDQWPALQLKGVDIKTAANGAKEAKDLVRHIGDLSVESGAGSALDGRYTVLDDAKRIRWSGTALAA